MIFRLAAASLAALFLISGCATGPAKGGESGAKVVTTTSGSTVLPPAIKGQNHVLVKISNPTGQDGLALGDHLKGGLSQKGYRIVDYPDQADYTVLGSVIQAGEIQPEALKAARRSRHGTRIIARETHAGLLSKAVGSLVDGARAKCYAMIVDVKITCKQKDGRTTSRQNSKTRIVAALENTRQPLTQNLPAIEESVLRTLLSIF